VLWFEGPDFTKVEIDSEIDKPHSLSIEDFNLDGDPDFAVCGSAVDGIAAWYENDGRGRFTKHLIAANQASYDLRSIDMDGDDDMDLLNAGHFSNNIVWFEKFDPLGAKGLIVVFPCAPINSIFGTVFPQPLARCAS
jgi:hypothetical protein